MLRHNVFADISYYVSNHAMFPNYLCANSFRDATYNEVYSASDF
jgi:hypothetical protein